MSKNFMSNGNATSVFTEFANAIKNRIISSMIASKESSTTASKAYSVGSYLILNDVLYKVTTAIAQGGTIVTTGANANVQSTSITDEIKFTTLIGTLAANSETVSFTNAAITSTARFETYTWDVYLPLIDIKRENTTLTLTFPKQESAVSVKVLIYED